MATNQATKGNTTIMSNVTLPVSSASHQTAVFVRNEGNRKAERAQRFVGCLNGKAIKADVYTVAGQNVTSGLDLNLSGVSTQLQAAIKSVKAAGLTVEGNPAGGTVSDDDLRAAARKVGYNSVVIFSGTEV